MQSMKLILSVYCTSFTGTIQKGHGYAVQRRKSGFYGRRNTRGVVPPDGHWRFIVACAKLAGGLYVADIKVTRSELRDALYEAHHFIAARHVGPLNYNAADILELKKRFEL